MGREVCVYVRSRHTNVVVVYKERMSRERVMEKGVDERQGRAKGRKKAKRSGE